jgi:hypothetical protein
MEQQYVTLKELAQELGLDRSNMRKYVLAKGLVPVRVRTPDSRQQLTLALLSTEAELVREWRSGEGFVLSTPMENGNGYFYIIQLVPDLDGRRLKFGFTNSLEARLQAHRTASPTAILLASWPCQRAWEQAAIASITRQDCTLLSNEVYVCNSVDEAKDRAASFFNLMPK